MPDKIYYYGPPPSREDMERGFNVIKSGVGCLLFVGFWAMVLGGLWTIIGRPSSEHIWAFFNRIGTGNVHDILILLFILSIVSIALIWAVFVMKRRENKLGCIIFIVICLVILVGSIGLSGWEYLQQSVLTPATTTLVPTASRSAPITLVPTLSVSPSTTPIKPGQILCQSDWSHGMDGWSGSSDWKVYNGQLLNDGSNSGSWYTPTIMAPCHIGTGNYAVEVRVKMQGSSDGLSVGFGIEARGDNASDYYETYLRDPSPSGGCCGNACITSSAVYNPAYDCYTQVPWAYDTAWHTYRFELQGTTLRLFIDGTLILKATDYTFLDGWQVSMNDSNLELAISSFKVIAL